MGCIFSTAASCVASCIGTILGGCICSACHGCYDKSPTSSTGREQSVLLLLLAVILSLTYQYAIAPQVGSTEAGINWDSGCDYDDDVLDDKCRGNAGVYRVGFTSFLFFTIASLVTKSKPDYNRYYWSAKFAAFMGLVITCIWIPNSPLFDPFFLNIARIGGFIFILMQSIILIDLAYTWNESWVDKSNQADAMDFGSGDKWLKAIIAACITLYTTVLVFIILLFATFDDCSINKTILSFTTIFIIVITAIQLTGEEGSLLTSAVISLYGVYLAFSALSKNPDYDCNPLLGGNDALGITMGILLTLVTVFWVGWSFTAEERLTSEGYKSTSSRSLRSNSRKHYDVALPFLEDAEEENDKSARLLTTSLSNRSFNSDGGESDDDASDNVWKLNLVLLLVSCFFTVSLTGWGSVEKADSADASNPQAGHANLWIIIVSQWFTFLLYGWTLAAPRLFPDRDFS